MTQEKKIDCLTCGKNVDNAYPRYFVIPGMTIVPNEYYLCDKHKNVEYYFEDIYEVIDSHTKRKQEINHNEIIERSK